MDLNNSQFYIHIEEAAYGAASTSPAFKIMQDEADISSETSNTQVQSYTHWVSYEMFAISKSFNDLSIEAKKISALEILKKVENILPKIRQYVKDAKYKIKHDTTTYLLSSPANAEELFKSMEQLKQGKVIVKNLADL